MLKHLSRERLIVVWLAVMSLAFAGSLIAGTAAVTSTWILLLVICLAPPVLSLMIWHGAPPPTVAQVLHAARDQRAR